MTLKNCRYLNVQIGGGKCKYFLKIIKTNVVINLLIFNIIFLKSFYYSRKYNSNKFVNL